MNRRTQWLLGSAIAFGLLVGSVVATGVNAQTTPAPGPRGTDFCSGPAMMGAGFGPGVAHDAVAAALGITSSELRDAQAAGKSVATIAQEQNVDLTQVVDAALAAHGSQLEAAVNAGAMTQAQADAMAAFMKTRIESAFQGSTAFGPHGVGMMNGHGMMAPGSGPRWRNTP
jgi:hypothetical protein